MAKVTQTFFCTQEKKKYHPGDEYTGSRKDLSHVLEGYEDKSLAPKEEVKKEVKKRTPKRPAKRKRGR